MATVAAVVVSWNTRDLLLRCLDALAEPVDHGLAEAWVVDNGSSDGSPAAVRERAPWAHLLEPGENLGFGRAVNLAASHSQSDWILIANADAAPELGAIERLLAVGAAPQVGCVAPRLVLPDGSTEHSVHPFPTLPVTLAFNLGAHVLSRDLAERLWVDGRWSPDRPRLIPWAIGACLLVRRSAFEQVGGFDERLWMYAEDLDLQWRLTEAGFAVVYEPGARVRHDSGAAARQAFGEQRAPRFMAATYGLLARRRGSRVALSTALINLAGAGARVVWMAPAALCSGAWRARWCEQLGWLRAHAAGIRSAAP
jgi:GT2 family glycosyltransferase